MSQAILEENKALIKQLMTEVDRGNLGIIDESYSDDYVDNTPSPIRGLAKGKAGIIKAAEIFKASFPDTKHVIHQLIAEDDRVTLHMSAEGTHTGELFGVQPTGKKVTLTGISIYVIKDGKISERWAYHGVGVLDQLGIEIPK